MTRTGIEAQIGYWRTWCCELDLEEIIDDEMVAETNQPIYFYKDGRSFSGFSVWKTKEEALTELLENK